MSWFLFRRPTAAFPSPSDPDDVGKNLRWLETVLQTDRSWLDEVEAKITIDAQTEIAKKEVKAWAYDAEELLDEWKFEELRAAAEPPPPPSSIFGRRYARDPVADLLMDPSFRRRVDDLKQRREEIGEFNRMLRLGRAQGPRRPGRNVEPPPSSSLPGERAIYGREDDKKKLVNFLLSLSEDVMDESLTIIPIVGAAGVGKTTLAQHIYNNEGISSHFKPRGWVSASKGLQITDLMRKIRETLTEKACSSDQFGAVQGLLNKALDGRRFLLVLDDIRYETLDPGHWEMLRATFKGCADGSVIIFTTQDDRVADKTETVPNYILESLTGDLCLSVFREHAFGGLVPTDARLMDIGTKIAKECQGSPLVAKALGVRLRHERDVETWEEFLQRDMWDEVVPELKLSYHRLPAHLKRCFVYCSMFPKGYLFSREELVRLWMAQGFIEERKGKLSEDMGLKYFDDLSTMSFFQKSPLDPGAFVMPNLLHALALSISDGECLTVQGDNLYHLSRSDQQKVHHLSLTPGTSKLTTESLASATHLRSFVVVPTWPLKNIAQISLSDEALRTLNHLRVLDVRHTDIMKLPSAIADLKHLRYLNLSGTKIENIHASIFQLYSLQTLDLSCTSITELPDAIGNLSNLLHLPLNVTKVRTLPKSIGKLSKLQTLNLDATKIEELPETIGSLKWLKFLCLNISKIQRLPESICELSSLQILDLQGAEDEESNKHVLLIDTDSEEQLKGLLYQDVSGIPDSNVNHVNDQGSYSNDAVKKVAMFENLQCHTNHRKLDIMFSDGMGSQNWMGDLSFSKLNNVILKSCVKCKTLPQLGQLPLLKKLDIDGISVEHVGRGFCGLGKRMGFPSLEQLSFRNMCNWMVWDGVEEDDFPSLEELILFNCPKLKGVPCFHSSLTKLKVERCAVYTIPPMDSLKELELCACDNISELPFLNSLCNLTLMYCQNLRSLVPAWSLDKLWYEECELFSPPSNLEICRLSSTAFLATPMPEHVGS